MVTYVKIPHACGSHFGFMQMRVKNDGLNLFPSLNSCIWSCTTFMPKGIIVLKSAGWFVLDSPLSAPLRRSVTVDTMVLSGYTNIYVGVQDALTQPLCVFIGSQYLYI
jgi:hypothetical protein